MILQLYVCVCVCMCVERERERLTCSFDCSGLGFLGGVMVKIGSSPVANLFVKITDK